MQRSNLSPLSLLLLLVMFCQPGVSQSDGDKQAPAEMTVDQKAENGDAEAQNEMGLAADAEHRYADAFKWFQLAAKQGVSKAQVSVGYAYDNGLGVQKDQVQAVYWYALAAAQGDPQAEFDLGMCYHLGEGIESDNAAQNRRAAIKWFSVALTTGTKVLQMVWVSCTNMNPIATIPKPFIGSEKEPNWVMKKLPIIPVE